MNRICFSPESQGDLLEIKDYLSDELSNPNAANRTLSAIMERIRSLQYHANLGALLSSVTEIESDYRFLVCGSYLIF